ncbi:MAG: hypothetical protein DI561_03615 [Thauera sp.]|nr:MAG: hypothetical protein DI561_03615 [Thauera sp.]
MDMIIPRTFNGRTLVFSPEGWLNISAAALAFGRQLGNFMGKPSTWTAMEAVEDAIGERCWFMMDGQMWADPQFSRFFTAWLGPRAEAWWSFEIDSVLKGTFTPDQAADAISATIEWLVPGEADSPRIVKNVIAQCLDRILPDCH